MTSVTKQRQRSTVITGAGGGLGREIALGLAAKGYGDFGTAMAGGRIVQISTWTASLARPFNGPSGASKAAMEVIATVYRAELKQFGIDVVVAPAGNMKTGGPAKTAAALARIADKMTPEQRGLYGQTFSSFAAALNGMHNSGLDSASAARRVIELSEQVPAPIRAAVGQDSEEMLRFVREKSDAEQDAFRLKVVGLS